eukprot:5848640-Amphidinium_carterae.1
MQCKSPYGNGTFWQPIISIVVAALPMLKAWKTGLNKLQNIISRMKPHFISDLATEIVPLCAAALQHQETAVVIPVLQRPTFLQQLLSGSPVQTCAVYIGSGSG